MSNNKPSASRPSYHTPTPTSWDIAKPKPWHADPLVTRITGITYVDAPSPPELLAAQRNYKRIKTFNLTIRLFILLAAAYFYGPGFLAHMRSKPHAPPAIEAPAQPLSHPVDPEHAA